jgi:chromosome partitioning protein
MILTVGGQKGGSGKSCMAQNLSVALAQNGQSVMLIDADPQRTSADWAEERALQKNATGLKFQAMSGDISDTTLALSKAYDHIVIDCGGRDTKELRSAMIIADVFLVPLRPKRRDLKTLDYVSNLVDQSRIANRSMTALAVVTQAPTLPNQAQRILDAKSVASSFGLPPLQSVIYTRNVYDDCEEAGLSVFEAEDEKAKEEVTAVLQEIMTRLEAQNAQ